MITGRLNLSGTPHVPLVVQQVKLEKLRKDVTPLTAQLDRRAVHQLQPTGNAAIDDWKRMRKNRADSDSSSESGDEAPVDQPSKASTVEPQRHPLITISVDTGRAATFLYNCRAK